MADKKYDNTDRFTLFQNDKGDNENRPDFTGPINLDGIRQFMIDNPKVTEFRLSGWVKGFERDGEQRQLISGSIQPAER